MSRKSKRGKHTSVHGQLRETVRWLESLPFVKRVIFGPINPHKHGLAPGSLTLRGVIDRLELDRDGDALHFRLVKRARRR